MYEFFILVRFPPYLDALVKAQPNWVQQEDKPSAYLIAHMLHYIESILMWTYTTMAIMMRINISAAKASTITIPTANPAVFRFGLRGLGMAGPVK